MYLHSDDGERKLDRILSLLQQVAGSLVTVIAKENFLATELDTLTAQVQANTDVEQSAIVLIQGLAAQIAANATDPAKLTALSAQLSASATALGAAITANTPSA